MATEAMRPTDMFSRPAKKTEFFNEKAKVFRNDNTKITRRPMGQHNVEDTKSYPTKMVTKSSYIGKAKKGDAKDLFSNDLIKAKLLNQKYKSKPEPFSVPLPKVLPVSIQDASAELNKLSSTIDRLLADIPENVVQIDRVGDSCFRNPLYAQDIINYQMAREKKLALKPKFLEHAALKPHSRSVLVDWLIQVQNHSDIQTESLHIAVALLDRFLSKRPIPLNKLQLFGVVCLFIACKINERFPPEIEELLHLTENTYNRRELLAAERLVLRTVGFDLNLPTTITFIDRCVQATEGELGDKVTEVKFMAFYMLHLGLIDGRFSTILPSKRAAAAYWLARKVLMLPTAVTWNPSLSWYSGYSEHELRETTALLAKLCLKAPESRFQGARTKYGSKSRYGRISFHPSLANHELLKNVALSTH